MKRKEPNRSLQPTRLISLNFARPHELPTSTAAWLTQTFGKAKNRRLVRHSAMKIAIVLFAALTAAFPFDADAEPANPRRETRYLLIPASQPEQKLSEAMQGRLKQLNEEDWLSKLNTWNRLKELPAWVFEKQQKPEIAYLGSIPASAMDAFRYAVITGSGREMIVVRAGGFAGVYEIFQKKAEPNQSLLPTAPRGRG
jgi:hypothetical protein